MIKAMNEEDDEPWLADMANYVACSILPAEFNKQQLKKFMDESKFHL